jgi:integrase/recombinase XerD
MKPLTESIQEYLALRRSLGFKLRDAGARLAEFASFMAQRRAEHVTTALALQWAQLPREAQPAHWAQRLGYVRGFARHHLASDPRTEVPPPGLLPFRPTRLPACSNTRFGCHHLRDCGRGPSTRCWDC